MRWSDWWLRLEAEFVLPSWSCHGPEHWRSVERNAIVLARETPGADLEVARAFALFHDSQRQDDGWDEEHGPRAADFVELHRAEIPLRDDQIEVLVCACRGHTGSPPSEDPTIGVCWDADRLDFDRFRHNKPRAEYMSTDLAKRLALEGDDTRKKVRRMLWEHARNGGLRV
ncbi:MAG: hypothetical protein WHU10_09780 [Fimbriimonadales bacterium]